MNDNDLIRAMYNHEKMMATAEEGQALIDNIPRGNETQLFEEGQELLHKGTGSYRKGLVMIACSVQEQNGYYRYEDEFGMWHRQVDLEEA